MQQQTTPQPVQTAITPQQQAISTPTNVILSQQQIQVVRTNQQSPGLQHSKMTADHFFETNAFDNKTQSPSPSSTNNKNINNNSMENNVHNNSNNLLIMANVHKEFSCSIGDENTIRSSSPVNSTSVINISNTNNNNAMMIVEKSESDEVQHKSLLNESIISKVECKNTSVANTFINLSSSKNVPGSSSSTVAGSGVNMKNINVIVTQQPLTQQLMKTLSFSASRGIFVPNVIATNLAPQFTVHQYGLHGSSSGPAPNVTVNPNGNFNTNSGAIRPGTPNHFRLLLQQSPNINFNIINSTPSNNTAHPSPILEASLQTITKEANMQASKVKTIYPNQLQRTIKTEETSENQDATPAISNDQHIRVLTPSEIMKTLPSLSSHDSNNSFSDKQSVHESEPSKTSGSVTSTSHNISNSSSITISSNSCTSSPLTITTTTITSECNNTFSSHFNTVTKATAMSSTPPTNNNAQIIMVRGYINV